MDVNTARQH